MPLDLTPSARPHGAQRMLSATTLTCSPRSPPTSSCPSTAA